MGTTMAAARAPVDMLGLLEGTGEDVDSEEPVDVTGVDCVLEEEDVEGVEEDGSVDEVVAATVAAASTRVSVMLEVALLPSVAVCVIW